MQFSTRAHTHFLSFSRKKPIEAYGDAIVNTRTQAFLSARSCFSRECLGKDESIETRPPCVYFVPHERLKKGPGEAQGVHLKTRTYAFVPPFFFLFYSTKCLVSAGEKPEGGISANGYVCFFVFRRSGPERGWGQNGEDAICNNTHTRPLFFLSNSGKDRERNLRGGCAHISYSAWFSFTSKEILGKGRERNLRGCIRTNCSPGFRLFRRSVWGRDGKRPKRMPL